MTSIKIGVKTTKIKQIVQSAENNYSRYAKSRYTPMGYDNSLGYSPFAAFKAAKNKGKNL